jgi:hypothetical protein
MRQSGYRFVRIVSAAAIVAALAVPAVRAQDFQLDTKALDPSLAGKAAGKKAKGAVAPAGAAATGAKPGGKPPPDRQHGELEGWSPGKAPPSPEEKDAGSGASGRPAVNMTPSGNVGTGFTF